MVAEIICELLFNHAQNIYLQIGASNPATSMCDFLYVKVVGQDQDQSWLCRFASVLEIVLEMVALRQELPHGGNKHGYSVLI